jgi:flagellum-specific peptidoglycan hydrolase FlgJ
MSLTTQQKQNLSQAALAAVKTEQNIGLPSRFTIAQWAQESGWGEHAPGNNVFGIKAYEGAYGTQTLETREGEDKEPEPQEFATFASLDDCFDYHAKLICLFHGPYWSAWQAFKTSHDVQHLVRAIAPIYAPGNPDYADAIITLMRMQAVADSIWEAHATLSAPPETAGEAVQADAVETAEVSGELS